MYKTLSRNIQRGQLRRALEAPSRPKTSRPKKPKRTTSKFTEYFRKTKKTKAKKRKPARVKGPESDAIRLKHFDRIRTLTSVNELGSDAGPEWLQDEIRQVGLTNWLKRVGRLRLKSSTRPRVRRVEIVVANRRGVQKATQSVPNRASNRPGSGIARRPDILDLVRSGFVNAAPASIRAEIEASGVAAWLHRRAAQMSAESATTGRGAGARRRHQRGKR